MGGLDNTFREISGNMWVFNRTVGDTTTDVNSKKPQVVNERTSKTQNSEQLFGAAFKARL